MGVTFGVVCEQCGVEGPEVGDFGYIGAPSLELRTRRDGLQSFGSIYEGLEAIGVVTQEIEAFKTFLDEHRGHPIALCGDGEEELDEGAETEGDADTPVPAPARAKPFRFTRKFREIFHELHCETCHETHRSSESAALRPFEPFAVSANRIKLFRERVVGTDSLYRVGGFPFDEVAELDQFLRKHRRHHLIARLAGGKTAPRPKGVAPQARAIEPWVPPEWPPEASEHALGPVADEDLPALMSLRQNDPAVRREAALEIGRSRKPALLGYLVSMLDDPETAVRAAAVTAIGAIPDARIGRPLGRALLDESEDVRSTARAALLAAGISEADARAEARAPRGPYTKPAGRIEASIAGFERALGDPRGLVRHEAVERLAKRRDAGAPGLLLRALADPWALVRHEAAEALAAWPRDPRVIPALIRSLTEYGDAPDRSAIVSLEALKAEAAVPVLRELLLRNPHPYYYPIVNSIVGIGGRAAADALADALTHPSTDVRVHVAASLAGMEAPHVAPRFLVALSDPDERVRVHAAVALQQTDTPEVARALVEAYRTGGEDERGVIVESLGKMSGPEPLRVLVAALRERSTRVRATAARELDARNDPRGNRALIAAARRGDATVALHAWRFFVGQGVPGTEAALERALFQEDRARATEMAAGLLTCANARLARAANTWLEGRRPKGPKIEWGGKPRPV